MTPTAESTFLDQETGRPPWKSSPYRAKMLRDLDWAAGVSVESLDNASLARIHAWYECQMSECGSCHVPVDGHVRKERRDGKTGRRCWRFVVYTSCRAYGDAEREHGEYRTRHEASIQRSRFMALRWVDELDPRYGALAACSPKEV